MEVIYPQYYTQFHCIASACPDSCCKEWAVDVDPQAAEFYLKLDSALGDRLRQVLHKNDDSFVMGIENGRCPMWRQDGLCRIQAELGHDALCQVCREFPRLRHDYGNFVEMGLELSCPEAARLILSHSHTKIVEHIPGEESAEYDIEAMDILLQTRKTVTDFLNTTTLPVNLALSVLLLYTHEAQSWLDGGEPAVLDVHNCITLAEKYAKHGNWELLIAFFRNLEILTPQWRSRLTTPCANNFWDSRQLLLAQYFIDRYWLQAVSDYDLIGRVKLLVSACLLLHHLGGALEETAQLFSKEIENDPDNLDALLDGAYTSPALTDLQLLSLLLNG